MTEPNLPEAAAPAAVLPPDGATTLRRLFISYRRRDSQGVTGRLYDGLERFYGDAALFRDVSALTPGVAFATAIERALADAPVVVVVIGPRWVEFLRTFGSHPGDGPIDYVRLEVETALRLGKHVVPLLVDGAAPLVAAELPDSLRPLAGLQAHELTDRRWAHDLSLLRAHLDPHLQQAQAPWPRIRPRLLLPAALAGLALYAAALWWPTQTASPIELVPGLGMAALVPSVHRLDGGMGLLVVGALIGLWLLAGRLRAAAAGRLDRWLADGRVLAAAGLALVAGVPPLVVGRPLFAGVVVAAGLGIAAARRPLGRLLAGSARAALGLTLLLATMAISLALDVWLDHRRQADYDVALLLPPEGADAGEESLVIFREFRSALSLALAGMAVDIAPPRLGPQELEQLNLQEPQRLLDYKGPRGAARVFIRVRYELDANRQPSAIGVWPYLRPSRATARPQQADDWHPPTLIGPAPVSMLALRAAFELIAYLSERSQLRLTADEQARVWRQLLQEHEQVLRLNPSGCSALADRARALHRSSAALTVQEVRSVLFAACAVATPVAPEAMARTAGALWSATLGR